MERRGLALNIFSRITRETQARAKKSNGNGSDSQWHAVSIDYPDEPYEGACFAVRQLTDKRFLSDQAPVLPLADCQNDECSCSYMHHADRRSGNDRRVPSGPGTPKSLIAERRGDTGTTGRRKTDFSDVDV